MDKAIAIAARSDADLVEEISNIKVNADDAENGRRIQDENARLDRYETLQIEAITSNRKNAAVEMKWSDLARINIAQELAKELETQTISCQAIIDSKDRRIREFLAELEEKNFTFVKAMKRAEEDVRKMAKLITENVRRQREVHRGQLKFFEEYLQKDRADLLAEQKKELDALFEQRRQREESEFLEQRQEREKQFHQKNEDLCHRDLDEFNKVKMSLEGSIQELEQHLERTMATYQLNKEKLDYNLQVLAERNKEHSAIEASYKTKLSKLRDAKQRISDKFVKMETTSRKDNGNLTEELARLMQQYRHVLEKTRRFEEQDQRKFSDVWANNETEVRGLVEKVLDGDRIIHEQLLGLAWTAPTLDQIQQEIEVMSEAGTVTGKSSTAIVSSESGHTSGSAGGRFSGSKVKAVMDWIRDEASFLLDISVKEHCHDLPPEHRAVVEIDAILRSIGCEDQRDVDLLVSQFFRGQDEDDETWLVEADDVLSLITEFIVEKENLRLADVAPDKKKKNRKGGEKTDAEKAARRRKEERKFWERIGHALPSMSVRLHAAVESCLSRQYRLLHRRAAAVEKCITIERENHELKEALDNYLGSGVNQELQVPPTHVIRLLTNPSMPHSAAAEEAKRILKKTREHNCVGEFLQPVDWKNLPGLQDYPLIVKRPMDLGTVLAKVEEDGDDAYADFGEFEDDLNLIWDNCHLFNRPGSYISHLSEGKQSRSSRRSSLTAAENSRSAPSSRVKVKDEPFAAEAAAVLPPMDKAAVDGLHAAKIRLGWRLHSSLSPQELALVVEFMRTRKTAALKPLGPPDQDTGSESLLLDIDHLSALDPDCFTDVSQLVDLIIRYKEGS
ncbi:hypothetical protein FOZ63_010214 [Perkinsus olseni]|uniref:Bromo domain-containing protein n=1 Tax=Perkinsus olseni TaxID=32597 RepID=A0A7J6QYK5_PEROL|nr:hypothetical protein FOZ63_010214 [Perkinsus olseni]KAF4748139.1 hypothetical protein FOZ62_016553 [Perkinsus olseni]